MTARDERASFSRGIRQFNAREFWHAHESWEAIWLVAREPDKTFLQGIIQIAAAFYHHQKRNHEGMRSLMRRGLVKVEEFPAAYRGLRLEQLRRALREWLAADARGEPLPRTYPLLRHGKGKEGRRFTTADVQPPTRGL
jgi:predicted metal-dependent hydrolase